MKISVVILAYNEEAFIGKCLESLKNQEESPYEIIVVDNDSTDNTVEIVNKYDVCLIKQSVRGITPTRNKGFNTAKGDIIARVDADTWVEPSWIRRINAHFEKDENIVGFTGGIQYDGNTLLSNRTILGTLYQKIAHLITGHYLLMGPNLAIKRSVWDKIRNETCRDDTKVHEDVDLSIHLAPHGNILYDAKTVVHSSSRRILNNPYSFFIEYTKRYFTTIFNPMHKKKAKRKF